ncbi:hypothetical protein DH2020_029842 [Rehmannia glutinosa]|uniref:Uncharacterized protein n=1 Tax=Rehmannia glutinosa TaxID=99300 RepID=A0ABR0VQE3_REHGL
MSTSEEVEGGDNGGEFEGPSSSRRRMRSRVWPEPFVEALAFQAAIDASNIAGRLAAAQALFNIFQVCSTWRAISRSELLWQNLTRRIWNIRHLVRDFLARGVPKYRHRPPTISAWADTYTPPSISSLQIITTTAYPAGDWRSRITTLPPDSQMVGSICSIFRVGSKIVLPSAFLIRLLFSSSVSGIILSDTRLVFATLDGDIHAAVINGVAVLRRAHMGDVVNDGALVDFTGSSRWCSRPRFSHMEQRNRGASFRRGKPDRSRSSEEEFGEVLSSACSINGESTLIADGRGRGSVRRAVDLEEVCRFTVRGASQQRGRILGCVNGGYGVIFVGGVIRVWEIEHGQSLYSFRERIGECNAIVADERCVAACSSDGVIHVWDFGAQ